MEAKRKTGEIAVIVAIVFLCSTTNADLIFDSGYNVFDDSNSPQLEVGVLNDAHLDVLSGEITGQLSFWQNSTGNIYGGELNWLWTDDNSVINVYGGTINWMASRPDSTVYLHAYDVNYYDNGGELNQPWLEGKYISNDNYFSFTFNGLDSVPQVEIVPEPSTLVLLSLGLSALLKKKK